MKKFSRAILLFAFQFRSLARIARSLESMLDLYSLDCASRGIIMGEKNPKYDEVEIAYGVPPPSERTEAQQYEDSMEDWSE